MVWGFIIGLVVTGLIVAIAVSGTNKRLSVLSCLVAVIMFVGLSIACNKLINAIEGRHEVTDFVGTIVGSISSYIDYSDASSTISYKEANQIALGCKMVQPGWNKYFRAADFQGRTYDDIPTIISQRINRAMGRQIWNMIGWIVLIVMVGTILLVVFSKRKSTSSNSDYEDVDDGGYSYDY